MPQLDTNYIRSILYHDPIWSVYALADLQPPFAEWSHWYVGESADGPGVVLLYSGLEPPILMTVGSVDAVEQALAQILLPDEVFMSAREEHLPLLQKRYEFGGHVEPMTRMVLNDEAKLLMPVLPDLRRLTQADSEKLRQLYANGGPFTPGFFDPYMLDDGVFFGILDQHDELLAVGGTHILNRPDQSAAIGNMYTHPQQRGNGYASAILCAIVATLRTEGMKTLVLNVDRRNAGARRIYERHGFQMYCDYVEGTGTKK
ncbi:MAG: GNAT family N-acetyltransferase [Caldilineaceae bacterium]|nr:GNAT family N-acetyltransferase [Caldilineaceae bacterium]MCB0141072.1 GNAT family N-acetyltransferase [Caldilineaceae bacterium]